MHPVAVQSGDWFDKSQPRASLLRIRDCGFEAVDLNINNLCPIRAWLAQPSEQWSCELDTDKEGLAAYFAPYSQAIAESGVTFCSMHAPFPLFLPENRALSEYALAMTEQCIRACGLTGCRFMVVHPVVGENREEERRINREIFSHLAAVAREQGVILCVENMFYHRNGRVVQEDCACAEELCYYVDTLNAACGEERFGACLDTGHALLAGQEIPEMIRMLGSRLKTLHLHENDGIGDMHRIPYTCRPHGGAAIDWEAVLLALREVGYEGAICFETFRSLNLMPAPAHDPMLRLIAAVGGYFKNQLEEK